MIKAMRKSSFALAAVVHARSANGLLRDPETQQPSFDECPAPSHGIRYTAAPADATAVS